MADIYLYPANATPTDTESNGLGVVTAIRAEVSEELVIGDSAGSFTAQAEILVSDRLAGKFTTGAILKISTPLGPDLFRIDRTEKSLTTIKAECSQITSDLRHSLVLNRAWLEKPLTEAWPQIVKAGQDQRFSGMSDIGDLDSLRLVRTGVLAGMIGRQDNTVLNRWGGELYRHGWAIDMLRRRGANRNVAIRYGKNLTGINDEVDDRDVFNSVVATYLVSDNVAQEMPAIDSPLAATAPFQRTVAIHYGDIKLGAEIDGVVKYPTVQSCEDEIRARVAQLWADGADKPRATCEINFIDLRRTEEYKNLAVLEQIEIGDTLRATWADHVDIEQRVIAYDWDALENKFTRIILGSPRPTLGAWRNQLDSQIRTVVDDQMTKAAGSMIEAVIGLNESYVNALGYYETVITNEATGAKVKYIHDQPELIDSLFIATTPEAGTYMWTETGWNDGNPVWTQGISKEGNLIIRFIQAVRLNAEWIQVEGGGSLADTLIELRDGTITIRETLAGVGNNLLTNPTLGTYRIAEKTGWSTGYIMHVLADRFKGKTMAELQITLAGKTIQELMDYDY